MIGDITGLTALKIVDAILTGEHDPKKLTTLHDGRIKATAETIIKSLVGDYLREHLFTLRQSLAAYRSYQKLIVECDREIKEQLKTFDARVDCKAKPLSAPKVRRHKVFGNEPRLDLRAHLYQIFGVDLAQVPGMSILTAHTLLAEVGPDLFRFSNASAFSSWLGLCPDNYITGGKKVAVGTRHVNNRAAWALRMAANALRNSRSGLGDYYRRMRANWEHPKPSRRLPTSVNSTDSVRVCAHGRWKQPAAREVEFGIIICGKCIVGNAGVSYGSIGWS